MTVFDVQEKRRDWKETIRPDMTDRLVFLDESGINTALTRLYGRAPSSQRVVDHTPLTPRKPPLYFHLSASMARKRLLLIREEQRENDL